LERLGPMIGRLLRLLLEHDLFPRAGRPLGSNPRAAFFGIMLSVFAASRELKQRA
jgi:hypothetical protein